jgi:membrane-associated phospholipid phosphatase
VAFVALAVLVGSGAANGVDQWACDHAMPLAGAPGSPPTLLESVVPLLHASFDTAGGAVAAVVTLPGQVLVSLLLVAIAARALWRRGRREAAAAWLGVWFVATAVEVIFRHTLTRPPLYRDGVHVVSFDTSWPSGHALRCTIVAAALATAWPRLRVPLAIWLAGALVLLELAGFHTPTDITAGLLLAAVAAAVAVDAERSGLLGRRAALLRRSGTGTAG